MISNYQIYLICSYNGQPIDFLLPIYTEDQFRYMKEIPGTCFKIQDTHNAEILLACRDNDRLQTIKINIESACKANSNISFSIIINEKKKKAFLRAFTDDYHNDCYTIPHDFIEQAKVVS